MRLTLFGDGEFRYFRDVFLIGEDAQRYIEQNKGELKRFHLRTITIKLGHDAFFFPDFNPERFDHYKIEDVLAALEIRLQVEAL